MLQKPAVPHLSHDVSNPLHPTEKVTEMVTIQIQTQEWHVTKTGCADFCHMTFQIRIHPKQKMTELQSRQSRKP